MIQKDFPIYKYPGALALIKLHEIQINKFVQTWKEAKSLNIILPATSDKDYLSLDSLLRHVVRSARGYMIWICEKLSINIPEIKVIPDVDEIEDQLEDILENLLNNFRIPLADLAEEIFFEKSYRSPWGAEYCIEAMLEHAVMHPLRHEFQLRNLILSQKH